MSRFTLIAIIACLFFVGKTEASADEKVWSALIYARNEKIPTPPSAPLEAYDAQLRKVFGYNQFEILGEHRQEMSDASERWLLPGKPFSLSVTSKEKEGGNYHLKLKLFQDKRLLVKTEAALSRRSPIFIRGPLYEKGHLILALFVE